MISITFKQSSRNNILFRFKKNKYNNGGLNITVESGAACWKLEGGFLGDSVELNSKKNQLFSFLICRLKHLNTKYIFLISVLKWRTPNVKCTVCYSIIGITMYLGLCNV